MSIDELDKMIPVSPPMVNKNTNPIDQIIDVDILVHAPCIVAIQLNTLIPVGTAMIIVADVK